MSRHRLLLFGVPIALVGVVWFALWLAQPHTAITLENAALIREGMTLAEVEAILGGPERDESSGPVEEDMTVEDLQHLAVQQLLLFNRPHMVSKDWLSDTAGICVRLDRDAHTVILCQAWRVRRAPESPLARLRRWLRL
jgi:hypothetical protein